MQLGNITVNLFSRHQSYQQVFLALWISWISHWLWNNVIYKEFSIIYCIILFVFTSIVILSELISKLSHRLFHPAPNLINVSFIPYLKEITNKEYIYSVWSNHFCPPVRVLGIIQSRLRTARELPSDLVLGFRAFTAVDQVQPLVRELRSHKSHGEAKTSKTIKAAIYLYCMVSTVVLTQAVRSYNSWLQVCSECRRQAVTTTRAHALEAQSYFQPKLSPLLTAEAWPSHTISVKLDGHHRQHS